MVCVLWCMGEMCVCMMYMDTSRFGVCKYFFESEIYMFWTVRYVKLLWGMSDYSVVRMQDMNSGVSHGYLVSSNCLAVYLGLCRKNTLKIAVAILFWEGRV